MTFDDLTDGQTDK